MKSGIYIGVYAIFPNSLCTRSSSLFFIFRLYSKSRFFSSSRWRCMASFPAYRPYLYRKSSSGLLFLFFYYSFLSLSYIFSSFSNVYYSRASYYLRFITSTKSLRLASTDAYFSFTYSKDSYYSACLR